MTRIQLNSKPPVKIDVKTYPSKVAAGQEVWVVANIVLDRGWHIYGNPKGPGPGLPTILEVTSLPEGVTADPNPALTLMNGSGPIKRRPLSM
jgi:hypothetical protein